MFHIIIVIALRHKFSIHRYAMSVRNPQKTAIAKYIPVSVAYPDAVMLVKHG